MKKIILAQLCKGLTLATLLALPASGFALTPSNVPLYLTTGVAPNFVITLDDSGSMTWAYVPDAMGANAARTCTVTNSSNELYGSETKRFFLSGDYNAQYYNPAIQYSPPLKADGTSLSTSFSSAYTNGFYTSSAVVDLANYKPTYGYKPGSTPTHCYAKHPSIDTGSGKTFIDSTTAVPAYYYRYVSTEPGCSGAATDEACYVYTKVTSTSGPGNTDERQNFANWYSFYRTRNLATVTAASRAFQDIPAEMRVAWQGLTTCNTFGTSCTGWSGTAVDNRIRKYDTAHKARLYQWLFKLPATGSTPLREALGRAGQYFTTTSGTASPYAFDPQVTDAPRYSCRANYSLMMTDGVWNGANATGTIKSDSASTSLPSVYGSTCDAGTPDCVASPAYTPVFPYKDTNDNSLADVAFHYWATDLNADLKNDVARFPRALDNVDKATLDTAYWDPKNDPAKWQHMVTYTVGLGLTGAFQQTTPKLTWAGDTYAGSYEGLKAGAPAWPATGPDKFGNVADLWHAAINSRGKFFSAEDPDTLTKSLKSIVNDVGAKNSSAASIAANSKRLETSTRIYQASFDSGDWSGELEAFIVTDQGLVGSRVWAASEQLPAHASRNIATSNGTGGVSFLWGSLDTSQQASLGNNDVLNYLRGDQSKEVSNGGTFRNRTKLLGDIVNSDPLFIGKDNFGLDVLPSYATSYKDFVAGKSATTMIYVGANDGMLHGFDAATGVEKFAYVPKAVLGDLSKLTATDYQANHRYFVDGAPGFGDAYWGSDWRTVLIGTLGAGGKAVFALDVTNPDTLGASKVLWEFAGGSHTSKMGFIFGEAFVARFNDGKFYAVFSNGYDSTDNQAGLFLVRVDDPSIYYYIDTKYGTSTNSNGLSTPKIVDFNNDRTIDAVYAGDLQGNVWKFDVSSTNPIDWKIAHGTVAAPDPMFVAKDGTGGTALRQPIQGQVGVGPVLGDATGTAMVYFGTGRYFVSGDAANTAVQTFYGVLDDGSTVARNKLQSQSIVFQGAVGSQEARVVTSNSVDWNSQKGWYLDLIPPTSVAAGERVISPPLLRYGRVIFNTLEPNITDACQTGSSWLMELDAATGGNLAYAALDINGDGEFNDADFIDYGSGSDAATSAPAGVKSGTMTLNQPTVVTGAGKEYKFSSNVGKGIGVITEKSGSKMGRASWRQLQ